MDSGWKQKLFAQFQLHPNVAAYLDWPTGIMRINSSMDDWLKLITRTEDGPDVRSDFSQAEINLLETVTHETTHFIQIVTTAFLYTFAANLRAELDMWVAEKLRSTSHDIYERLHTLVESETSGIAAKLRPIFATLDQPGPEGVTVRSIVESAAFLAQKRTHHVGLTAEEYSQVLAKSSPGWEYRHAYDIACRELGTAAFDLYPLLASAALCTAAPETIFVPFCKEMAREFPKDEPVRIIKIGSFFQALERLSARVIGSAAQAAGNLPEHPIYTAAVNRLNVLHGQGAISLDRYMVAPHEIQNDLFIQSATPLVFNKTGSQWPISAPPDLWPGLSDAEASGKTEGLVIFAALYSRVLAAV